MTDLKQYGLNNHIMNSLALFIYNQQMNSCDDPVKIFNSWSTFTGIKKLDLETVACILEHIRKLIKIDREDLKQALIMDHLINSKEETI